MSTSLPEHPDLDQLRRQAKELRDAARRGDAAAVERFAQNHPNALQGAASLAAAQLIIARELGFASWPQLKAAVDALDATPERLAQVFVAASVEGRLGEATTILGDHPDIASYNLELSAVLGDADQVRARLAGDPAAAVAIDEVRGWPPLLYACYSHWPQIDPARAAGIADVVQVLLAVGANPDTNNGARNGYRSALKGAVEQNNPDVVRVLLDAGANPDLGRPIGEAAGLGDHRCLELLLSHGARVVAGTWTVGAAVFVDDALAVSMLLEAMDGADGQAVREASEALPDAAAEASPAVVAALLDAGADPNAYDGDRGMSALRRAVRAGKLETVGLLARRGATDDGTDIDRFIGACLDADRPSAEQLLAEHPDLRDRLTEEDRAVIVEAAGFASGAVIELMLHVGFTPHARNGFGEEPLHWAAHAGKADVVRLLIDAGAELDGRDARFESTPLTFATVGSGERAGQIGDWVEVVRSLIDAGASREGVWISGKPPSEEVADLLRGYGISPDDEPEVQSDEADIPSPSLGTGVMADIARHIEAAYRDLDLELLGSLLHREVHWSGCRNSGEVLDWYRNFLADGTTATVESVEVDRDAVILGLGVARRALGTRPAPSELLYQVFTVDDTQVTDIRAPTPTELVHLPVPVAERPPRISSRAGPSEQVGRGRRRCRSGHPFSDVAGLRQLIADHPGAAAAPLGGRYKTRTPLHAVSDWPGYFPNGPEIVRLLVEAGADPNAHQPGEETALHWAASSDDWHVAAALIEAGADINVPDGSIGTPLANAVGYGCWDVARPLVARGADVDQPWVAAALGLLDRLAQLLGDHPSSEEVSQAFWHACAGGQRRAAEYLLGHGAELDWVPEYAKGTALDAATGEGTQRENLIGWLREQGAQSAEDD